MGSAFPGIFEPYVANIVYDWQKNEPDRLRMLAEGLQQLGLTWKVQAKQLDATGIELKVGRLPRQRRGGAQDLVNIADVGFGVCQVLPVLVALLAAQPGQMVYLEQPESHLHPRAQVALAGLLADAAQRGVRVVVETHSALLLLTVQSLVAEGSLPPSNVSLNWFRRRDDGTADITTAELDGQGAYGDWPEDFGETLLASQERYLDAVEELLPQAMDG